MEILLVTLNARFSHASLGLRYLHANLGALQTRAEIMEFVIGATSGDGSGRSVEAMLEKILAKAPLIVGFGVYIWNIDETTRLVALLKRVSPKVKIILGGPEVSFPQDYPAIVHDADYVVTGQADHSFRELCEKLLTGSIAGLPLSKTVISPTPNIQTLTAPYALFSQNDLAHRNIYFEASRGCPFKCEFCLSALDKTAWPFELRSVLHELQTLYDRGLRRFKFVDRTFNLKIATSTAILEFFLSKLSSSSTQTPELFVHFELVPDHLPDALKNTIAQFPQGVLQFEIGIQTWNPDVQHLISRKQDNDKAANNISWLVQQTHAHLHVDLIAGLPGETLTSFGQGFDKLYALGPHEIQVGILKRLRGAPIDRHTNAYQLVYNPKAPYNVLCTSLISFQQMQQISRFSRYWDMFANSGRFSEHMTALLGDKPFDNMMRFADWLYAHTDATHQLALPRQAALLQKYQLGGNYHPSDGTVQAPPGKLKSLRQARHAASL